MKIRFITPDMKPEMPNTEDFLCMIAIVAIMGCVIFFGAAYGMNR